MTDSFVADYTAMAQGPPLEFEITPNEAWCIAAQIQLACRHPANTGPSRQVAEQFARQILKVIATTPELKRVAEMGWNPQFDVEP